MAEQFDAYESWLGIPPEEQPPDHYRLLGVPRFEKRREAIEAAVDERLGSLHAFRSGEHAELCGHLIAEITAAKACLLNPNRRAAYDRGLLRQMAAEAADEETAEEVGPISTDAFVALLEQRDLLPLDMLGKLRQQIAAAKKPVSAATVARRLVEQGLLTRAQAKRLLAAGGETPEAPAAPSKPAAPAEEDDDLGLEPIAEEEEELVLAPLDDEPRKKPSGTKTGPAPKAAAPGEKSPKKGAAGPSAKPGKAAAQQPAAAPPDDAGSLFDEEFASLGEDLGTFGGPLDGLTDAAMLDAAAAGGSPLAPVAAKKKGLFGRLFAKKKRPPGEKTNVWDSPLILVGGGTLLVLLILLTVFIWAVSRQSGEQAFQQADADYEAGSYAQAIHKYDLALESFPNHPAAGLARVHRGLARLRQATPQGTTNWPDALQTAKAVIEEIGSEDEFPQAKADLSAMLLRIAEGLAGQAQGQLDPALVAQSEEALALLKKYVPKELRNAVRIGEVEALLATTVREIDRDRRRDEAIAQMKEAAGAGKAQEAYRVRNALLKEYPELLRDEHLEAAVLEVSAEQQKAVRLVEEVRPSEAAEPTTKILSELALASRTTVDAAPGVEGRVVCTVVDGAAYGLDASTGRLLWRRFLGFANSPSIPAPPPVPVSSEPGSDLLLAAPAARELVCVEAATGRLGWRHPVGEPFTAAPVATRADALLATEGGKLLLVDLESGESSSHVQLPQALSVAPALDLRRGLAFQLARQSDLFVISLPEGTCRRVEYVGHEAGSITAPPVLAGRLLLFVVNDRAGSCLLKVLAVEESTDGEGLLLPMVQQQRLEGHVDAPPAVSDRRVAVVTDAGAVHVFEFSGTETGKPLTPIADTTIKDVEPTTHYPLLEGGWLWVAGTELRRYEVQISRRMLTPQETAEQQGVFLQAPVLLGQTLVTVRRTGGLPGATVAAAGSESAETFWEAQLAAPPATEPALDPATGKVRVLTAAAAFFEREATAAGLRGVADQPLAAPKPGQLKDPITHVTSLGDRWAATFGDEFPWVAVFDAGRQPACTWRRLPGEPACPPTGLGDALVCPIRIGQVLLWDPVSNEQRAAPFQPRVETPPDYAWSPPAPIGQDQFVLCDGQRRLFRVGVSEGPPPGLEALSSIELAEPITSPTAAAGAVLFGVDGGNVLIPLRLPELERLEGGEQPLGSRCVWGPAAVGDRVVFATDAGELWCFGEDGKPAWPQPAKLDHGPLAGRPLLAGNGLLLACAGGVVSRIDASTGQQTATLDVGRPLGAGPVLLGEQLLLVGHDGTLYLVKSP